jgi:hypothetical protein
MATLPGGGYPDTAERQGPRGIRGAGCTHVARAERRGAGDGRRSGSGGAATTATLVHGWRGDYAESDRASGGARGQTQGQEGPVGAERPSRTQRRLSQSAWRRARHNIEARLPEGGRRKLPSEPTARGSATAGRHCQSRRRRRRRNGQHPTQGEDWRRKRTDGQVVRLRGRGARVSSCQFSVGRGVEGWGVWLWQPRSCVLCLSCE